MVSLKTDPIRESLLIAVRDRLRPAASRPGAPGAGAEASWAALAGLGAPAFDAPLSAGGMALGLAASTAVAEELGRFALPGRYLAVAFAIDVAAAAGAPAELVSDLVAGRRAVRLAGFGGPPDVDAPEAAGARPDADPVLAGDGAGGAVADRGSGGAVAGAVGGRGVADRGSGGAGAVEVALVPGGLSLADGLGGTVHCPFDGAAVPDGPLARARIRQAAYLYGLARGALVAGVQYAGHRRQFGRALREFQSVAFRLAETSMEVEALRLMVSRAAGLADGEHAYGPAAAEALGMAAEVAARTTQVVLQVCGVRGMTEQLRVHRHYLRVREEARRLGPTRTLWRELGRDRLAAA